MSVMKAAVRPMPDCPSLEALVATVELAVDCPERQAVECHLAVCVTCSTELALLREFERDEVLPEEREPVAWIAARLKPMLGMPDAGGKVVEITPQRRFRSWASPLRMSAFSAAAVLVLSLGLFFSWHAQQTTIGGNEDTLRSAPLRALAPTGDLNAQPEEFRWNAVNGAGRYFFKMTEVDGTTLFETRISATSLPLPGEIKKLLQPGKPLLWSVRAEDSSGHEISTSAEQRFRLRPRRPN